MNSPIPADGVAAFKRAIDAVDAAGFLDWFNAAGTPPADAAAFVRAERSRLVKLKSLGLTQGTDARLALIDDILTRINVTT